MTDKTIRSAELDNVKKATAMMFAALVDTVLGTSSRQSEIFIANLDKCYAKIRNDSDDLNGLELLSWTRKMITGFDLAGGEEPPLMKNL